MDTQRRQLSDAEKELQARFDPRGLIRFTSTAKEVATSEYIGDLVLPENSRGRLPYSREDFVVSENPARVEWEREVRKFLARLNSDFGHKVSAPMIYEWATGISVADLLEIEKREKAQAEENGTRAEPSRINMHLRHINWVLAEYFGTPRKTTIFGRPVGKAYTVRQYFRVKMKKPANLTLIPEWDAGTL